MENLIIGKANTMYTLWNKRVVKFNNYISEQYSFLKNVSKRLDKVKEIYPCLPIDESLRGTRHIERTISTPMEDVDKFNYGKYKGELLTSVNDVNYLIWYLNDNKVRNKAQAEWAKENLDNVRFYDDGKFYDGVFMTIKEYDQIIEKRTKLESLAAKIKAEKSIVCTAVTNIDCKGFLIVMYDDIRITVHFTGETKEYNYQGYYYYLPVSGGKAKRIKNKQIILNIEDVDVCYSKCDRIQITSNLIDLSK